MAETQMSPQEAQKIESIARNYFTQQSGSPEGAEKMMQKLAGILQEEGANLVHLGNVVFLILVRGKGVVEFHTIGSESTSEAYAKDLVDLANYVKNIGVKLAYTYTDSRAFERVARLTGLPITKTETDIDGKRVFVYAVEF
jgi:hypothetical protein